MADIRIDIRLAERDVLHSVFAGVPAGTRSRIVRTILEAALVPGGWAKLADGHVYLAALSASTPLESNAPPVDAPVVDPVAEDKPSENAVNFVSSLQHWMKNAN